MLVFVVQDKKESPTIPCDYVINWKWRSGSDFIQFTIFSRLKDKWTGIGFSNKKGKVNKTLFVTVDHHRSPTFLLTRIIRDGVVLSNNVLSKLVGRSFTQPRPN